MQFAYKAVNQTGKVSRGLVNAESREEALQQLRSKGLFATQLEAKRRRSFGQLSMLKGNGPKMGRRNPAVQQGKNRASVWNMEIHFGAKVKGGEFAVFTRQLATLLRAGVTIADAIRVLAQQTENKTFARALHQVTAELQKGNQLSQAASDRKDVFPMVFINMVRAGETAGNLDEVLDRMALFFEKEHYTREKVKSAMTYPVVVSVMAVTVTWFLMVKVVPTFVGLFASFHAQLPLPTRIVLATSHFFVQYWIVMLGVLVGLVIGYRISLRGAPMRYARDVFLLKLPIFGQLFVKSAMSRTARTMASLFASAVPVLQALQLTSDIVENEVVSRALRKCRDSLTSGQSLSEPLSQNWVFPPLVVHMIRVGEETGNLDYMLSKIADFYEAETEAMVDRLKSLLEPVMILFLAGIVGTIVTSIILPMFSLYQQVGNMS